MRLYQAEIAKVTVTDGTLNNASALLVSRVGAAAISTISSSPTPARRRPASPFNLAITAKDSFGNGVSGVQALTFANPSNSPTALRADATPERHVHRRRRKASVTLSDAQSTTVKVAQGAPSGTSRIVHGQPRGHRRTVARRSIDLCRRQEKPTT